MTKLEYCEETCRIQQRYIDGCIDAEELKRQLKILQLEYIKHLEEDNIKLREAAIQQENTKEILGGWGFGNGAVGYESLRDKD